MSGTSIAIASEPQVTQAQPAPAAHEPTARWNARTRALALVALALVFPHLPFVSFSLVGVAIQAGQIAIVATALVMLTGWVGQISLGHAALVGVGGFATGWATSWHLPFPFSTLVAAAVAAVMAGFLGLVALRVRGLYLAVATLIFSWMADAFLFRIPTVIRHNLIDVDVIGDPEGVPRFDLNNRTTSFYVTWGVVVAVLFLVANLRDSRTGRAFFALRGSEIGAASLGIDVTRYKLLAFTVSGFLAGIAGSLVMLDARSLTADQFQSTRSLFYLAVVVVGGLRSLSGAVASSLFFAGLDEVFFRVRALGDALDLVSAVLLTAVLLAYPGGLAALPTAVRSLVPAIRDRYGRHEPESVRDARERLLVVLGDAGRAIATTGRAIVDRARDRLPSPVAVFYAPAPAIAGGSVGYQAAGSVQVADAPVVGTPRLEQVAPGDRADRDVVLAAENVTVRFGGLAAVSDASLTVGRGEIVGLIGPNGAGKTTLFNAIAGLNEPTSGRIVLLGEDATSLPVHRRARLGVARTFQAIQLFPELDVFENLLVATHVHQRSGFLRDAFATDSSIESETAMRERVASVVDEVGLADVARRRVTDLPFGVLRLVEVARAVVTGFPMIMLDEPASGLDNRETDRLSEMLRAIRARGATLLLIEHDVRMVTSLCDFIYVLNRGEIIAEGPAAEVQRNEAVVAAYLGRAAHA